MNICRVRKKIFNGSLEGKLILTAGLGGMGGAQPLAATMNGAAFLGIEVNIDRLRKGLKPVILIALLKTLMKPLTWC